MLADPIPLARAGRTSLELSDWRALLTTAEDAAREAHDRLDAARERAWTTASLRARGDYGRATRRAHAAERDVILLRAIWDTTARIGALLRLRLEDVEWLPDGALVELHDKRTPRNPDGRRPAYLSRATAVRLRNWLSADATAGWVFEGDRPGHPLTDQAANAAIHRLAVRAGVQRRLDATGRKLSHKHLVTSHAIRELAEFRSVANGTPPEIAAQAAGHTDAVRRRYYGRAGADAARLALDARATDAEL